MSRFKDARILRAHERDHALDLDRSRWPHSEVNGWRLEEAKGLLWRSVRRDPSEMDTDLWEAILRFPSAPIHGLHRVRRDQERSPGGWFHSLRLLAGKAPARRPDTIYLLLNGLNESHSLRLYYRLASYLVEQDRRAGRDSICILRPFPGHLGRTRYERFSQSPLDKYLADGSHLFQQFMRFMVETQWLLSVLVTQSQYWCPAGAALLADGAGKGRNRLQNAHLSKVIADEWLDQKRVWLPQILGVPADHPSVEAELRQLEPVIRAGVRQSVDSLRSVMRWRGYRRHHSEPAEAANRPSIHVLGYSLGGFAAQSILMAWPFAVTSCSTMLAGGALRELAPTAFAHPEEWQTVLHSLRYELDDLMAAGHFQEDVRAKRIASIPSELFRSLHRVFYEVFQQEYRGSYRTRMSEYGRRMLFVVGGSDPIVRPQSVLDSAPPEGVNLMEIGGLGHFLRDGDTKTPQSQFWLPEAARLIARFGESVVDDHARELRESWLPKAEWDRLTRETPPNEPSRLREDERLAVGPDGSMPSPLFERWLDDLLARLVRPSVTTEDRRGQTGFLFILRSEIPTALLPGELVLRRALNIHHENERVVAYARGAIGRGRAMTERSRLERLLIVLSAAAEHNLFHLDPPHGLPSQAETPVGYLPWSLDMPQAWAQIQETVERLNRTLHDHEPIRSFTPDALMANGYAFNDTLGRVLKYARIRMGITDKTAPVHVTAVPDCWIWVSDELGAYGSRPMDADITEWFCRWASAFSKDRKGSLAEVRKLLAEEKLRILRLSGARFNPRFRGHVVADPEKAMDLLLHAALCVAASEPGMRATPREGAATG